MYVRTPNIPNEMIYSLTSNVENVKDVLVWCSKRYKLVETEESWTGTNMMVNAKKALEKQNENYDKRRNVMTKRHENWRNKFAKHGMGTIEQIRYKTPMKSSLF